jgi:basic membrane protein A
MKKLLLLAVAFVAVVSFGSTEVKATEETFKIAMITDAGTIDDKSFNQGTWEGIEAWATANGETYKYYKPSAVSDDEYLATIQLAVEGGAEVVVTPGFLFETSVYAAQDLYPNVKFILIDGTPHNADYSDFKIGTNTVSILFNEHESGFLAGYAAVAEGYTKLGFTGGMAVPAVVKFGVGFVAGAYYAADELDKDIEFGNDTYTYFGEFGPKDEFKNLAAGWYVSGTEVIFSAAGGAGSSVMAAAQDNDAMMIGVDIDQSADSDTVLTSALKELGVAVQEGLNDWKNGTFPGGETITMSAANDGVGLPMDTSRFDNFTTAQYDAIFAKLKNGDITVPSDYATLVTFLGDAEGYPSQWAIEGTEAPEEESTGCFGAVGVGLTFSAVLAVAGVAAFVVLRKKH